MPEARKPVKRSPLCHALQRAGAALTEVAGWVTAEHFGDAPEALRAIRQRVGVCDRSFLPKFEIQGRDLAAALGSAAAAPGRVAAAEWGYACRFSPDQALLVLGAVDAAPPAWLSDGEGRADCAHIVERTHGYGALLLCGPAAPAVLRKLTSLDTREEKFPDLSCATGPMAAVRVLLTRKDRAGLPAYEVFFSREHGEYLWTAVLEAGAEFELRPFGLTAARQLV